MTPDRMSNCARAAWLPVVASLALAGCATTATVAPPPAGQWQGRFAITVTKPPSDANAMQGGEDRAQGRFRLLRSRQGNVSLDLFSPFGQTLARAGSEPQGAWLVMQDGRRLEADDPDTLVERALGWRLPVTALPDWLAGKTPAPTENWRVNVEQRFANGAPRTLQADWPAQSNAGRPRLRLRIVVDGGTG